MNPLKRMRTEVKKYIDTADDKVVKMIHAMLEVDANEGWWETMPDKVKKDLELALQQSDNGEIYTTEQVKASHPQWFAK